MKIIYKSINWNIEWAKSHPLSGWLRTEAPIANPKDIMQTTKITIVKTTKG